MLKQRVFELILSTNRNDARDAADGAADPRMRLIWGYGGMADATDSKSVGSDIVWVQVPLPPPAD